MNAIHYHPPVFISSRMLNVLFFFHQRNIYLTPDFCYKIGEEMDISKQTKFELPAWALTTLCYCIVLSTLDVRTREYEDLLKRLDGRYNKQSNKVFEQVLIWDSISWCSLITLPMLNNMKKLVIVKIESPMALYSLLKALNICLW